MAWTYEYTSTRLGVHFKKGDRFICKGPAYKSAYSGSSLGYDYTNDPTEKQFWGYYSESGSISYPIHFANTSGSQQYYIADSSIGSNVSGTPIYYFDLNFIINGTSTNNTSIAKADVYIGGSKVASGVGDYYKQHLKGSSYEIKNIIVASGYTRYQTPTLKGTLNAKTAINIYIGKNYTYSFNANGGSGAPSAATKTYGVSFTFPSTKPTRTGYTFTGWSNSSINSGKVYSAGTQYSDLPNGNYTFYANWKANNYTLTLNANGGTVGTGSVTVTYDSSNYYEMASNIPSRTGYTFNGWYTATSGGKQIYGSNGYVVNDGTYWSGNTWKYTGNLTLYAQWTPITYTNTIAHWASGFNGEGNNSNGTYYNIASTSFTSKYNANFTLDSGKGVSPPNGYYLSSTFGTSYISGSWSGYTMPYNVTQKAGAGSFEYDYHPYSYTITYTMNGGTNNSSNPTSYNVLYGFTLANPTRTGHTFTKWTNSSGTQITGINVGANATFSSVDDLYTKLASRTTGNQTIVANWTANKYTVTFNANGGYTTPTTVASKTFTYNKSYEFPGAIYAKPGYVQIGWNSKADGTGTDYALGKTGTWTTTSNLTVYAKWRAATKEEQKIYLYNNGYCEAINFAKTSDWYGFKKGVVGAKDFTIGSPATSKSKTMQFKGMIVKNLT